MRILIAALVALTLAACAAPVKTAGGESPSTATPAGESSWPPLPPEPTAAEQADCTKRGGEMARVGLMGAYACVIPTRDAGKVCANNSDCEGECWISGVPAGPNKTARGECQPSNMPFGCHATLDKGVVSPELCVD